MRDDGTCRSVAALLPSAVERLAQPGDREPATVAEALGDPRLGTHLATCLRCQAELARYRAVRRLLQQLRHHRPGLPPGVVAGVVASLGEPRRVRRRRTVVVGSLTLAALAGVATAGLAVGRGRGARPAAC